MKASSRLWRGVQALLWAGSALPCLAQLSPQDQARLQAQFPVIEERRVARDWDGCEAAAEAVRPLALADWTETSKWWWWHDIGCRNYRLLNQVPHASPDEIEARHRPMAEHFRHPPPGVLVALATRIDVEFGVVWALREHGHVEMAEARMAQAVSPRLERLRADPRDAEARQDLELWARRFYGARSFTEPMQHWRAEVARQLGEGDPLVLALLRAQCFNMRQLGRPQQALAFAEEAWALAERHHPGDARLRAQAASERGLAFADVGRLADAQVDLHALLGYLQASQPAAHASLMRVHFNLAALALELADTDAAILHADASLHHAQASGAATDLAEARVAAMTREQARLLRGDPGAARALQQAIELATAIEPTTGGPAFALARHALAVQDIDLYQWAAEVLGRWADQHLDPMNPDRALLPLLQARAGAWTGDAEARPAAELAVVRSLAERSAALTVQSRFALAGQLKERQPAQAVWLYKQGANQLQQLCAQLPQADESLQRLWLADHEADLRTFIGLLIDEGRLAEAQQAIGVLRQEELNEYTRRSRGARQATGARSLSLTAAERLLDAALAPLAQTMKAAAAAADARADRRVTWIDRMRAVDPEVQAALDHARQDLHALLGRPLPQAAAAAAPTAAARPLAAGVVRLQYFVRDGGVDIVVGRGARLQRLRSAVPAAELNRQVHALRAALSSPGQDPLVPARQLHAWLLAPVAHHLRGTRELHVAADGVLRYLPFAALHDGQRWLAERVSLVSEWGDGEVAEVPRPHRPRLQAFGRTLPDAEHAALPGVAEELGTLQRLQGARVTAAADAGFTAEALRASLSGRPTVVHLASHFVLDGAGGEQSYLLLGDGQRLKLSEIAAMPWQGVHLALLSACDSAVPAAGQGREITGLAGVLRQAGVANVLATLWPISGGATARWMAQFYAPWRQPGAAAAPGPHWVATAQRRWLRQHAGTPLAHPHYWAAFAWMAS